MSLSGFLGVATFCVSVVGGVVYFNIKPESTAKLCFLGGSSLAAAFGVHYYANKAFKNLFPDWLYWATQQFVVEIIEPQRSHPRLIYDVQSASEKRKNDELAFNNEQNASWNIHAEGMNRTYVTSYCKRYMRY